jgi:hypothetical protein
MLFLIIVSRLLGDILIPVVKILQLPGSTVYTHRGYLGIPVLPLTVEL